MIVTTRDGGRKELRDLFQGSSNIPIPGQMLGSMSAAGRYVSFETSIAIPAVMAAIRLLSETVGTLPLIVYREGADGQVQERAEDTMQWELLHEAPNDVQTPFELNAYLMACLQGYGNAYLLKAKTPKGEVVGLYPVEPQRVAPKVIGGKLEYHVRPADGKGATQILSRTELIHIPGILMGHPYIGITPVKAHLLTLGKAQAIEEFGARYFANDGSPSGALNVPGDVTKVQRDEMRESWEARHRGVGGAHKLAVLIGGTTYDQIGVNAQDAQLLEAQRFSVEEIARMFRVPPRLIGGVDQEPRLTAEQKNQDFVTFSLLPWTVRFQQRFKADLDFFPDEVLFPEYLVEGLLRADTGTRYAAYKDARQGSWITANEVRAKENLPPVEGGDTIQVTPVGGAPNPDDAPPADAVQTDENPA